MTNESAKKALAAKMNIVYIKAEPLSIYMVPPGWVVLQHVTSSTTTGGLRCSFLPNTPEVLEATIKQFSVELAICAKDSEKSWAQAVIDIAHAEQISRGLVQTQ